MRPIPAPILARAKFLPGYCYALKDKVGFADPGAEIVTAEANDGELSIPAIISTRDRDRVGDVVEPKGCQLGAYKNTPVVSYGHFQLPDYQIPVGTSENRKTRQFTVQVFPDRVRAVCHFHQHTKEAVEVYLCVKDRIIRGTSIGFEPTVEPERLPADQRHQTGFYFREWELLEWAFCNIQANAACTTEQRDLARAAVSRGMVGGERLSAPILKSLEPLAGPKVAWSNGFVTANEVRHRRAVSAASALEPIRWNRSLSKAFDVALQPASPATVEYDWIARHIGCKVKEIYRNGDVAPSARMGSFLTGFKQALAECKLNDVRNLVGEDRIGGAREVPPVNEIIQLNSKQRDTFLVDGLAFYTHPLTKFAVQFSPMWGGIQVTAYTSQEAREFNVALFDKAHQWALANNFLKGEAFSLAGEFLERTKEGWDDVFLESKNKKAIQRILAQFDKKQKDFANRGVIFTGPPGTGKTLSGRIIRNKAAGTFIWVSSRDFHMSGSFGGIAYAFDLAKELAPSVLFVEDIDNWLHETSIDLLKTEMDGISRSSGVLTILTTNFPERLPEALIDRPGRFHEILHFAVPTAKARADMLRKWLPGFADSEIEMAVKQTDGYSGAHVYELANFVKVLEEQDGIDEAQALRDALAKIREQKELITNVQLQGSHYRPRKALTMPQRNGAVLKTHPLDRLLGADMNSKAGMTEGSGTGGGYLTTGSLEDANGQAAGGSGHDVATVKAKIIGVMKDHAGHAPTEGPHDAYLHTASMAVHHHHHGMAHPDHLKSVADGLRDIDGVKAVTQGTELPGGTADKNEAEQEGWEAVHQHAPSTNPSGETGEQKELARHLMRGLVVMAYRAHLPERTRSALEDCVHRKIPIIAQDHPEMAEDQRVAVAYSMCGEGKMLGLKAFPPPGKKDGDADGDGDGDGADKDGKDFATLVGQLAETIACLQDKIKPPAPATPPPAAQPPDNGESDQHNAALANSYAEPPKAFIQRFLKSFKGRSLQIVKEAADHLHAGMGMNCHGCGEYHKKSFGYARGLDAIMGALAADHQEGDGSEHQDDAQSDDGADHRGVPGDIKPPMDGDGSKSFDLDKLMEGLDDLDNRLDAIPKRVYSATGQRV